MTTESAVPATTATTTSEVTTGATTDAPVTETTSAPAEVKVEATTTEPVKTEPVIKAPEKYEFKAPEGSMIGTEVLGSFETMAREFDLTQDQAQKLITDVTPLLAKQQQARLVEIANGWAAESKADKEIGGDKFDANMAIALKSVDTFGTPGLKELLKTSGLGANPDVLKFLYKVGTKLSEDTHVSSGRRPSEGKGGNYKPNSLYNEDGSSAS